MRRSPEKFPKELFALLSVCLLVAASGAQFIGSAEANFFPVQIPQPAIVIGTDGSIDPQNAPVHRVGNVYTLTDNIQGYTLAVERDNIVLDGGGYSLQGNGSSTGIFVKNCNGVTVQNMNVSGFTYGIRLFAEDFMGITSSDNTLTNNVVTDNEYGVYISYSSNNVLRNNHMNNNTYNFWITGGYISERESGYINDIDASNFVDNKPLIYWVNVENRVAPSNAGYVAFVNCTNVTAVDLDLSNNGQGVIVVYSVNSNVTQNAITECNSGIYLLNSTSASITENNLVGNNNGIRGESSSYSLMQANNVTSNKSGIYFTGTSKDNIILRNNITANTVDGVNLWGSTNTSLCQNRITLNNETGINLFDSAGNNVSANTISDNTGIGIKLWFDADGNAFVRNYIGNNSIGILINDSFDNTILENSIRDNIEWGMRFEGSQNNNAVWQNDFVNNRPAGDGLQVSVTGAGILEPRPGGGNIWDNGTAGNYWSDYSARYTNATEAESSGTGDTPYVINENNIDHHPLITPISNSPDSSQPTQTPTTSQNPTPSASGSPTLTPSPSIPEFSTWIILPLILGSTLLIIMHKKRGTKL